jgi:MbtH protein
MSASVDDADDSTAFAVVVNHEEQYSIWFAGRPVPAGWREEGTTGTRAECLEHIGRVWTDMRPLSVRRAREETAGGSG